MRPLKLVLFLIILGMIIFFIGFNLENVSDISFGFHTFTNVPIFIGLFIAFASGVLVMVPLYFTRNSKGKKVKGKGKGKQELLEEPDNRNNNPQGDDTNK